MIAALLDHLWQSTLFATLAGLITLMLRHNQARLRYRLWLAASLKFLFPFSILMALGGAFAPHMPAGAMAGFQFVQRFQFVQQSVRPFAVSLPAAPPPGLNPLPVLLLLWLAGFLTTALIWFVRWCRIHAVLRQAAPLALAAPIPVKVTSSALGPGLFGVINPVLLLPEGIAQRLTQMELRAVLDHELCHLERNDNLTASIHMVVEALFWFHPLVWWLGARLIAERERACDESVVASGNDAGVYADGILKVCRFYAVLEPPLAAAILSPDLESRLKGIMGQPARVELTLPQKWLIAAAAALAIVWPVMTGWTGAVREEVVRASVQRQIARLQPAKLYDVGLRQEDTTSRAGCESHFLALLQALEKNYGKFAPLYPQRVKNDQDQLPISLTWKNGLGTSRYQEATVYMSAETAHVWDAHRLFDGRYIDAAAVWSSESESTNSVCLTEIAVKA
jgi:beta-lactamase regulating signal transducer with metallopeptidase domain